MNWFFTQLAYMFRNLLITRTVHSFRILFQSQLHGLNLSYNMLDTLVNFRPMTEKFVNLKQLNLSYNRLRNEGALEVFKPWSLLESLEVQGNPFVKTHNIETFGK